MTADFKAQFTFSLYTKNEQFFLTPFPTVFKKQVSVTY